MTHLSFFLSLFGATMTQPPSWPTSKGNDTALDFTSCGGTLHELQDGHVPELFQKPSQYVSYASHQDERPSVFVHDNVLPTSLVDALYKMTVAKEEPWGTYVTMQQVQDYWASNYNKNALQDEHTSCSCAAVAHFLETMKQGATGATATIPSMATSHALSSLDIHGVAVWALASQEQPVCYHVDYAELIRYEHNIMATPLWAGTLQCTRDFILEGGQFAVNLQGIQHYLQYGYKGCKNDGDTMGGWQCPSSSNKVHYNRETQWVTIPYQYNRMIGHSGHLPHLSAPFTVSNENSHRVILGFNVFRTDVGPTVMVAPEHSDAFRRRIKWHRALQNSSLSLSNIHRNKALTKLLVLAKREKQRQAFRRQQELLDKDIEAILHKHTQVQVEAIMRKCGKPNGEWPTAMDVRVHLQRRVNQKMLRAVTPGGHDDTLRVTLESTIQLIN